MKIIKNPNKDTYERVRKAVADNHGYCPCELIQTEDTKCICREFREQMADPDFEGYCDCMLYYKEKQK